MKDMENLKITIDPSGKKATLVIDLTVKGKPSASGKTIVIASSRGNQPLGETGYMIGLNVFTKEGV